MNLKPPIGVMPKRYWLISRGIDLCAALARHPDVAWMGGSLGVMRKWAVELIEIIDALEQAGE